MTIPAFTLKWKKHDGLIFTLVFPIYGSRIQILDKWFLNSRQRKLPVDESVRRRMSMEPLSHTTPARNASAHEYAAYTRVYEQDAVRVNIVKNQLSQGHKDFTVPDFHFLKMQNSGGHFGFFHDPQIYGRYFGAGNVVKEKVNFDYSVLVNGNQQAIGNDTVAWFNNRGDLMLVSQHPLVGTVQVKAPSSDTSLPLARFTVAKINNEYWYFSAIPEEEVTHVALLP